MMQIIPRQCDRPEFVFSQLLNVLQSTYLLLTSFHRLIVIKQAKSQVKVKKAQCLILFIMASQLCALFSVDLFSVKNLCTTAQPASFMHCQRLIIKLLCLTAG